ncbi:Dynamin central region-domain-containing protein [Mycena epipterygia]|nr:Dynamin central region-domain-containing protein [Mycena epipterygia]
MGGTTGLVSVINQLQDVFASVGSSAEQIDLPQICVLGCESSGKNSVIETIVGRHFLHGIVTRRPFVVQLINRPPSAPASEEFGSDKGANPDEWGEFLHLPGQKFFDFDDIRREIVRDTEANISEISLLSINLRIFSPHVLTLTLVDLPCLTKIPIGDQPTDIETQIRNLLRTYISKPACIILAVTTADQDLANSEELRMARAVDPEGVHTIGVLTKIDSMDVGSDVVDVLAGRVMPLRLGYVPVVIRDQQELDPSRQTTSALAREREFFENHPAYRETSNWGIPFLAQKLHSILELHIRDTLPRIRSSITTHHQKLSAELETLGGPLIEEDSSKILLMAICEFTIEFRSAIDGGSTGDLSLDGDRIDLVFRPEFSAGIKDVNPFDQVKDGDIRSILYSCSGSFSAPFVGTKAFEVIVKHQITRLREPSLQYCQLVHEELLGVVSRILGKISAFQRHPALRERLHACVTHFFEESMEATTKFVSDIVAMQACCINMMHLDFIGSRKATALVHERLNAARPSPTPPDTEKLASESGQIDNGRALEVEAVEKEESLGFFSSFFSSKKSGKTTVTEAVIRPQPALNVHEIENAETEIVKLLINSYFSIVQRDVLDTVPKAISLALVGRATNNLQRALLEELYKPDVIEDLFRETRSDVRRREVAALVEALWNAEGIVGGV